MALLPFQASSSSEADRFVGGALPNLTSVRQRGTHRPPPVDEIAKRLAPICGRYGITRLDLFGSVARGDCDVGSDVDLIAFFRTTPGLEVVSIQEAMESALGVPVDLLLADDIAEMDNSFRRELIERDHRL